MKEIQLLNKSKRSIYLFREVAVVPKYEGENDVSSEQNYSQQHRIVSIVSLRRLKDSGKGVLSTDEPNSSNHVKNSEAMWKVWKSRLAVAKTTEEAKSAWEFLNAHDIRSDARDNNHLSVHTQPATLSHDHESKVEEVISQLEVENNTADSSCSRSPGDVLNKRKESTCSTKMVAKVKFRLSETIVKKTITLQEKLADDREYNITGVMNLSSMNLTDNDMTIVIKKAFKRRNTSCIGFILCYNCLTGIGVKMLVNALVARRTELKYLNLSNNPNLGDAAIEHLVYLFQNIPSMTFLALSNTGMSDQGVRLLSDSICDSAFGAIGPPLEKLYLSFNDLITDESLESLLQILEQNHTLKRFSVRYCRLSQESRQMLRETCDKNKLKLDLSE